MQYDKNSPFHKKGDVPFAGLKFFDVDSTYKVMAKLTVFPFPEPYKMQMSDGSIQPYVKFAWANFNLKGIEQKVVLLKMEDYMDENWFFLPFYDETSARESYGGGRFLEIDNDNTGVIEIDFNMAYNPYCAYNSDYRCPIPPIENRITVAVEAGEKAYKTDH